MMNSQRLLVAVWQNIRSKSLAGKLASDFAVRTCELDDSLLAATMRFRPDILLLTVAEPDRDLCDIVKALRGNRILDGMKIVLLSEQPGESATRTELLQSGIDLMVDLAAPVDELVAQLKNLARLKPKTEIDDLKKQFRSLITHETSTPLNAITSYASMIAAEEELSEPNREMIAAIQQASSIMEQKIERVLLLADLSANPVYEYYPVYSEDLFSSLQHKLNTLASDRSADVQFSSIANVTFTANFDLIVMACWNLVENALKFSTTGSAVHIEDSVDDGNYVFQVKDAGPGIEAEKLTTLFQEFNIDDILHHKEGLGIGLSLCRRVTELHQGTLVAENSSAGGACFTLSLPL